MFEHRSSPLLSRRAFYRRVANCFLLSQAVVAIALGIGMAGYHFSETMNWVDAFENAAMILSGMGPVATLQTDTGKIFAGCYVINDVTVRHPAFLGQDALKSTNLPTLFQREWTPSWRERMFNLVMPTAFYFVAPLVYGMRMYASFPWKDVLVSLAAAVVCAVVGWLLCQRYHFSAGARLKWAGFHLLFGLPGLLGFLCVQEWPAHEPCPNCKKPRLVDREKCEHCGAEFAPPPKNGTEIFESIGTN